MPTGLHKFLAGVLPAGGGLSDAQLLTRFLATHDEGAFAALVRRHGAMVLGVCRRVLRDGHDAEDAFQATFFVLARKANSVVKHRSLGCWLHQVAYHVALNAHTARSRCRARERQMRTMPHPEVAAPETQDWRPLLDRELSRLPEKYRVAIVLCDLEGRTRRETARQLHIPEGTLSSRLATARAMLAKRLTRAGVTLAGGVWTAAMMEGTAQAQIPVALVWSTARAAALIAAGHQVAAASAPAAVLMKGVLKAMLIKKLVQTMVGVVTVTAALGIAGVGYRVAGFGGAAQAADKPVSEVDALRKEVELLKLNLQIVLEKVRAQQTELQTLRKPATPIVVRDGLNMLGLHLGLAPQQVILGLADPNVQHYPDVILKVDDGRLQPSGALTTVVTDAAHEVETALKALREARDKDGQRRAAEALEKAMKKLKEKLK
jgi:RNA polymerase sigma factor (sigma-70 family)